LFSGLIKNEERIEICLLSIAILGKLISKRNDLIAKLE